MNIIKYLPTEYKTKCIECEKPLIKDINTGEIFCSKCGMIFLDFSPMTRDLITYGLKFDYKRPNKRQKKSYS